MNTQAQNGRVRISVYSKVDGRWQADTNTDHHAIGDTLPVLGLFGIREK